MRKIKSLFSNINMKAIIHIGTPKTGTTTIQSFLGQNRESLKKQKVLVPGASRARHIELFAAACKFNFLMSPAPQNAKGSLSFLNKVVSRNICMRVFEQDFTSNDQDKLWKEFWDKNETDKNKIDLVCFSDEALFLLSDEEIERIKTLIDELFDDVAIVIYLRRQPEFLPSFYNTFIYFAGLPWHLSDYLNLPEKDSILAYGELIRRWSAVFGKNKIQIRIFDKTEFHNNDLLSDFAHIVGFDMVGFKSVENRNASIIDGPSTEFLRLQNSFFSFMTNHWRCDSDRRTMIESIRKLSATNKKAYHLTRSEAQHILDTCRQGNDWIACEYLGREKLFSEDVSMYPEEVASPHGLTLERCAEITDHLWKERCQRIHHLEQENKIQASEKDACAVEIQHLRQEIQKLASEKDAAVAEIERLLLRRSKRLLYRCKALLAWLKKVISAISKR